MTNSTIGTLSRDHRNDTMNCTLDHYEPVTSKFINGSQDLSIGNGFISNRDRSNDCNGEQFVDTVLDDRDVNCRPEISLVDDCSVSLELIRFRNSLIGNLLQVCFLNVLFY